MLRVLFSTILFISFYTTSYATFFPLTECYSYLCPDEDEGVFKFTYTYQEYKTYHSPRPWMTSNIKHHGTMWVGGNSIAIRDSFCNNRARLYKPKRYEDGMLLMQPINSKKPVRITKSMLAEEVFKIAKYHPAMLLHYFEQQKENRKDIDGYHLYTNTINNAKVTLYIPRDNFILDKVTITMDDELYGDVVYTISYSNYTNTDKEARHNYPQTITFEKVNGITDTIQLSYKNRIDKAPVLIEKPADYKIVADKYKVPHTARVEKINEHLTAIHLPQAESVALLVEFNDFFVVIDAPLNSKNGELVLEEAKKIAPNKIIRYYTFCHHHPWYIGGIRPFIHAGATVLTQGIDKDYVKFIANTPHSLSPDALHKEPKAVQIEEVGATKTITDGEYKMVMYHIGEKSEHTEDYTLFYFPSDKILFQGDMVFIRKDKPVGKAGGKQAALYNAIKDINIEVETIVQAWPWKNRYNIKTIIPYTELEESMRLREQEEK